MTAVAEVQHYVPHVWAPRRSPAMHAPNWPRVVEAPATRWVVGAEDPVVVEFRGSYIGGFEDQRAADAWLRSAQATRHTMITAADLYLGKWGGDEFGALIPCFANGWKWIEFWDHGIETDNGHVRLVQAKDRWVHPDTVLFIGPDAEETHFRDPWPAKDETAREKYHDYQRRQRHLDVAYEMDTIHVPAGLYHTVISRKHETAGRVDIMRSHSDDTLEYIIVWRRDARTKWGNLLTQHDTQKNAETALNTLLRTYQPPEKDAAAKGRYDRQKQRCYDFERMVMAKHNHLRDVLTLEQCKALADETCAAFGVRKANVVLGARLKNHSYHRLGTLHLAPDMLTRGVTLHEVAHHIVFERRIKEEAHGPHFIATVMAVYHKMAGVPYDDMIPHAKHQKLEWAAAT